MSTTSHPFFTQNNYCHHNNATMYNEAASNIATNIFLGILALLPFTLIIMCIRTFLGPFCTHCIHITQLGNNHPSVQRYQHIKDKAPKIWMAIKGL